MDAVLAPHRVGLDTWAAKTTTGSPLRRGIGWTEDFRLKNYFAELRVLAPHGVNFQVALQQFARAAYDKARTTLP